MTRLAVLPILATVLCGCVSVSNSSTVVPPPGLVAVIHAPLTSVNGPLPCKGLKKGTCEEVFYIHDYILTGLTATVGDNTIKSAMDSGGLKKLYYADYKLVSYLGFITTLEVTAYGE